MPEPDAELELTEYEMLSDVSFLRKIEVFAASRGWVVTKAGAYSTVLLAPEWARSRVPSYLVQTHECNTEMDAAYTQRIFDAAQESFPNGRWELTMWHASEWPAISRALELTDFVRPPLRLVELKTDA